MIPKPYLKAAAVLFAVVFALAVQTFVLPTWVAGTIAMVVIGFALAFWPVVLVTGVVYGSGNSRTFFIGAAAAAVMPYVIGMVFLFDGPYLFRRGRPFDDPFTLLALEWYFASPCISGFLSGLAVLAMGQQMAKRQGNLAVRRFGLSTLMIGMTVIAVFFGLVSAAPLLLVGFLFSLVVAAIPALLIAGIVEGRDNTRAFFIGALTAGIVPLLFASGYLLIASLRWQFDYYNVEARISCSVALIGPFIPMAIGGLISRRMRQSLQPAPGLVQPILSSKETLSPTISSQVEPPPAESWETT